MNKLLVMLLIGTVSMSANAVNWLNLGNSSDNLSRTYIDLDSIGPYTQTVSGGYGGVYKSGFVQFTYLKGNQERKKGWYYTKSFVIADCSDRSLYSPAQIVYGFRDQVIDSNQNKYFSKSNFNIVFPETIGDAIVSTLCW